MKSFAIVGALALCLISAPCIQVVASSSETVNEALPPAKKKTTKKTTKKSTTSKKSTKTSTASKNTSSSATKVSTGVSASIVKTEDNSAVKAETAKSATQTQNSNAGASILGGILSSVIGGNSSDESSSSSTGDIISSLTSIFNSSKVATKDKLIGTWTYTEPAVVFSSNNALKNIGGKVASQAIENQLQSQFEKYGIKKGAMTMTFDKNGNFTQTIAGRTTSGTYTVSGKNVTLKYAGAIKQIVGTTQVDGNDLLIVMDASKLLSFANTLGSLTGNSLLKSAGSLLGSMDGMEVGLKLNK